MPDRLIHGCLAGIFVSGRRVGMDKKALKKDIMMVRAWVRVDNANSGRIFVVSVKRCRKAVLLFIK